MIYAHPARPRSPELRESAGSGGGGEFQQRVDVPKGDPRDPMTEDEITLKFNSLGGEVVGDARCRQLCELIMQIQDEATLERLFVLMTQ